VKAAGVSHPAEITRRWTCHLIGIADLSYCSSVPVAERDTQFF
jgi:hypothetical protein